MHNKINTLTFEEKRKYFDSPTTYISTEHGGIGIKDIIRDENDKPYVVFQSNFFSNDSSFMDIHIREIHLDENRNFIKFRHHNAFFAFFKNFVLFKKIHKAYLSENMRIWDKEYKETHPDSGL